MKKILLISLLLICLPAYAQDAAPLPEKNTLEQNLSHEAKKIESNSNDKFITFSFENDSIGSGADQNYTNGVRLSYFDVNSPFPDFAHKIADLVPTFSINETSSVFYSVGQNLYTPKDISSAQQDPDDRPWAAFLYGSIGMASITGNHVDELEATIGVIGPLALGEQVQKAVHRHVTQSPQPRGWSNQIKNEPALILSAQRRWPQALYYEASGLALTAAPYLGASLGNVYTYASSGISARISPSSSRWSDTPQRVRPAMTGTGFFETPDDNWDWYIFGGIEGRAVARNIFLDGNTFTDSHSVDKFPLVGDTNIGVAFTYGDTRISYTLVRRTREFKTQDSADMFGAISLVYKF